MHDQKLNQKMFELSMIFCRGVDFCTGKNIELGGEHTFDTKVFKKIKIVYSSRVEHTGEEENEEDVESKLMIRISEYRY